MLKEVCWNHLGKIQEVDSALKDLRSDDSKKIGRSFSAIMQNCETKEGAVEEFIKKYPAIKEMGDRYVWFRPMILALATRAKEQSKIGGLVVVGGGWARLLTQSPFKR